MKKTIKIISFIFLALVLLAVALELTVRYFFHERIKAEIEAIVNDVLESEINFNDIHVSSIRNFPSSTVFIDSLWIIENGHTVLAIDEMFLRINPRDLINDNFIFSEVLVERAFFHSYVDSLAQKYMIRGKKHPDQASKTFDYHIPQIDLRDVEIRVTNDYKKNDLEISIDEGHFQMISTNDLISFEGSASGMLQRMINKGKPVARGIPVSTDDAAFRIGQLDKRNLFEGTLKLDKANVKVNGVLKPTGDGNILDMNLEGAEADLNNYLALIPQLKDFPFKQTSPDAHLSFRMRSTGFIDPTHFPNVDLDFMLTHADFEKEGIPYKIQDVYLNGIYSNGKEATPESSFLIIKEGFARVKESFVRLSGSMANFKDPYIDLDLESELSLEELNNLFDLPKVGQLAGKIKVNLDLEGKLSNRDDLTSKAYREFKGNVEFLDVSGDIPSLGLETHHLDGSISIQDENILLENFKGLINQSPFALNGGLYNFMPLLDSSSIRRSRANLYVNVDKFLFKRAQIQSSEGTENSGIDFSFFPKRLDFGLKLTSRKLALDGIAIEKVNMGIQLNSDSILVDRFHFFFDRGDIRVSGSSKFKNGKPIKNDIRLTADLHHVNLDTLLTSELFSKKESKKGKGASSIPDNMSVTAQVSMDEFIFKNHEFRNVALKANYQDDKLKLTHLDFDFELGEVRSSWDVESILDAPVIDGKLDMRLDPVQVNQMREYYTTFRPPKDSAKLKNEKSSFYYKDIEIKISAPRVSHHDIIAKNLKSDFVLFENNMRLNYLNFDLFGGQFNLRGLLEQNDTIHVVSTAKLQARNIDATQVVAALPQHEGSIVTKENVYGKVQVDGMLILHYDENLLYRKNDMIGRVQLSLDQGRLIQFRPVTESLKFLKAEATDTIFVVNDQIDMLFHNDEILVPNTVFATNLTNIEFMGYHNQEIDFGFNLKVSVSDLLKSEKKKKARMQEEDAQVKGLHYYLGARTRESKLKIESLKKKDYQWQEKLLQTRYKQVDVLLGFNIEKYKEMLD
ncbi:YdbH domain-containing protein [Reichenbachiella ulvae]|uniref:YdbH domain-containing protein n=1 Tax=Reichenbachiella ulvae TaxID=2980104 RepID=A0ABT3CY79_9BACT|nr:YdbH domain-containing protein [Reichenbachiella ulvae]MCV9388440.1 YdbH domain-containing protein [Reichenbachiella ulvae]